MNLPPDLTQITVFYDGHCGLCSTFAEFIADRPARFPIDFIPYQDPRALEVFPPLDRFHPDREMIVLSRQGHLFTGAESWVVILFATVEFRGIAERLAHPRLLPLARKTCGLLAPNRRRVSRLFFRAKDREVARDLHRLAEPVVCRDDQCACADSRGR